MKQIEIMRIIRTLYQLEVKNLTTVKSKLDFLMTYIESMIMRTRDFMWLPPKKLSKLKYI